MVDTWGEGRDQRSKGCTPDRIRGPALHGVEDSADTPHPRVPSPLAVDGAGTKFCNNCSFLCQIDDDKRRDTIQRLRQCKYDKKVGIVLPTPRPFGNPCSQYSPFCPKPVSLYSRLHYHHVPSNCSRPFPLVQSPSPVPLHPCSPEPCG